jgi:hypothetical protein
MLQTRGWASDSADDDFYEYQYYSSELTNHRRGHLQNAAALHCFAGERLGCEFREPCQDLLG